jgi:hypothetical protein
MQKESKRGAGASGDGKALRDADALPHGASCDVNARQDRPRMSVQDAFVRARSTKHLFIEVAKLGIDRGERGNGMALAEGKHVLPSLGRVFDVEAKEAAVKEGDE